MDEEEQNQNLEGWDQYGRRRDEGSGRFGAGFKAVAEAIGLPLSYVTAKPYRWLTTPGGTPDSRGEVETDSDSSFSNALPKVGQSGLLPGTEQTLADRYGATYDQNTNKFVLQSDPLMSNQLNRLDQFYRELDTAGMKKGIQGQYYNAAEQARRRAAIFGDLGKATTGAVQQAYTGTGEDIANLAQGGGTAVSGLTGPAQGFQSLYTTLPGTGETITQDLTEQIGFETTNLDDIARAALRSGTQQGKNLAEYIASMSAEQRYALGTQLDARNEQRSQLLQEEIGTSKANDNEAYMSATYAFAGLWRSKGEAQKQVKYHLGIKSDKELVPALEKYRSQYGGAGVASLAQYITMMGGIGG